MPHDLQSPTYQLLLKMRHRIQDYIEDCGGCDHSTGLCTCGDQWLVRECDYLLLDKCSVESILWATHKAAKNHGDECVKKWTDRVSAMVINRAREILTEE